MGYRIEGAGKHGSFEIAGVPKPVIDAFSQRRQAILAKAAELGIVSPQGRDEITTNTRDPKLNVDDRAALRQAWIDKAAGLGFDGAGLAESEGRSVLGLAFQNKMVADLGAGAGIESRTVAAFVHAHERFLTERAGPRGPGARGRAQARWAGAERRAL